MEDIKVKHLVFMFLIAGICCRHGESSPQQDRPEKYRKTELNIPMTDGILLSTDVYLPENGGRLPVILIRTPYDKSIENWMNDSAVKPEFAVVVQDVRGKFKSGGEFYPFVNERADGLQTLQWIRRQPWCNGKVAGRGGSYVGFTQWAISDSLDFICALLTGSDIYDLAYPDGLCSLQLAFEWGFQNASRTYNQIPPEKLAAGYTILPLSAADDSTIRDIPFINDWIGREKEDDYWKKINFRGMTKAPVISFAGWYDIFLKSQINDFQALEGSGSPDNKLIIGPWCHGLQAVENGYGGLDKTGEPQMIYRYIDDYLRGGGINLKAPFLDKKYNLFIMERNEYAGSDVWPPPETKITPCFIGPALYLGFEQSAESGFLEYKYDPSDPYPSHGGTIIGAGVGPAQQNVNTTRPDQVVFEMRVTDQPLILLGPVGASLWLSSSAVCTDFIIGLQDVFPDGKIINIQEGGARVFFEPARILRKDFSVWATGYQLNPGHKLRVVISSSWFPRFNRNLNTGEPASGATRMVTAVQRVYFGPDTPSSINLPVYQVPVK